MEVEETFFAKTLAQIQTEIHHNAVNHGWWEMEHRNEAEKLALIHSEVSEALEVLRLSDKEVTSAERLDLLGLELADIVIRVLDFAEFKGVKLGDCIEKKHAKNKLRTYHHGGKKF